MHLTMVVSGQFAPEIKIELIIFRLDKAGLTIITSLNNVVRQSRNINTRSTGHCLIPCINTTGLSHAGER